MIIMAITIIMSIPILLLLMIILMAITYTVQFARNLHNHMAYLQENETSLGPFSSTPKNKIVNTTETHQRGTSVSPEWLLFCVITIGEFRG